MNQYITEFLAEITATKAKATVANCTDHLKRFDIYFKGGKGGKFTRQAAVGFLLSLQQGGATPSSVSAQQTTLRTFYKWLAVNEYIDRNCLESNVVARYQPPVRTNEFPFTPAEYDIIKQVTLGGFWHKPVIVAWNTGMRLKDTCYLRRAQIDLEKKKITLKPSKTKRMNKTVEIPILPELEAMLLDWAGLPEGWLFPMMAESYDRSGNKALSTAFGALLRTNGIWGKSWHAFRHAFISRALTAGVPVPVLASITGQTMAVVERYTHITDFSRKAEALSQMV